MSDVLDPIRAAIETRRSEWSGKLQETAAAQGLVEAEIRRLAALEQQHGTLLRELHEIQLNRGMYAKMAEDAEASVDNYKQGIIDHLVLSRASTSGDGRRIGDEPAADSFRIRGNYEALSRNERIADDAERVLSALDAAIAAKQAAIDAFIEDNEL